MSTPDESTPASPSLGAPQSPLGAPAPSPLGSAPRPSFKVTRSPFAPKIAGTTTAPASDSSAGFNPGMPPAPVKARRASSSRNYSDSPGMGELALDAICAVVSVGAAVMMAIAYFK